MGLGPLVCGIYAHWSGTVSVNQEQPYCNNVGLINLLGEHVLKKKYLLFTVLDTEPGLQLDIFWHSLLTESQAKVTLQIQIPYSIWSKACSGLDSAPNQARELTAPSGPDPDTPPVKHKFTQQAWRAKML